MTSKTRIKNVKYLSSLARNARDDTKALADQVVKLYEQRKIINITTAENYLNKFASTNKNTRKAAINNFVKKEEGFVKYGLTSNKLVTKKKETEEVAAKKIQKLFKN